MMREQLVLDLPHRAALGADDFLVSDCNRLAVELIDAWPEWNAPAQLLVGPPASGKTHLVRVWQARSDATSLTGAADELAAVEAAPRSSAFVLEDADGGRFGEKALFHLLNVVKEGGHFLLLTARQPPRRWGIDLPDLRSRLNALPLADMGTPDGPLLKTVMLKQFADRQLNVEPKVLEYLALHVDRSLEAAARAVEAVDQAALGSGRKISRQLAAEALRTTQPSE
ncbi:hypothetical protein A7A08_02582 [Methyloligella halotolerans]|uniref:Uncharacterized protein n=1 Tax=Methyloligella halotolerans TaxID=1177755 RepID=A0A1E2RWL4_9HYPH|nr:DnaA/Hda family protein [Methyloligella halotolerans]ODA66459.1 hypothetical protein A7A08_02582 [Methyloligella halotolerans]